MLTFFYPHETDVSSLSAESWESEVRLTLSNAPRFGAGDAGDPRLASRS